MDQGSRRRFQEIATYGGMKKTLDVRLLDSGLGDGLFCRLCAGLAGCCLIVPESPLANSGHQFKASVREIQLLVYRGYSLLKAL